ncbi:MAG TPA: PLP-dependent cysteine synthase family protein [Chitinophaga sp.]|uniref:PLP-dependent cysteine synthase family protein n=1 Tax=Chitinophaga sp. TaxID=1869181 RepID=UPI002BCDFA16|nr:PLP-dependent cysteine synthase family protein [Chitinophaga sp.]HVI48540.1 PLP-dependent cysteine synthase family protein [Chitinophaga sp.]
MSFKNQIMSGEAIENVFQPLWQLVGNTPMLEIQYFYNGKPGKVYAKCEYYNLTGSVKDRMALYILTQAYRRGEIKPGDTIVEVTSGNTGIAFAAFGKALGHQVKIIMPDWMSRERIEIIKSMGAEVLLVSKAEGGFLGCISRSEELLKAGDVFLPRQFENLNNVEAHERTTGREIWYQLTQEGLMPDAFVAGVGTGGSVMGVGNFLKRMNHGIKVHPLEPAESPTLSTGYKVGSHRIQGISDEFIPAIVQLDELDSIIQVNDGDAILMAQKLSKELGLAVGISSGANITGAIKLQQRMGGESCVATLLCDSNVKYLSTDLTKEEPVRDNYITEVIVFTGYRPIGKCNWQEKFE